MKAACLMVVLAVLTQSDRGQLRNWAVYFLNQAEATLREEGDPAKLAHGAIVLAELVRDIDRERAERLLRMAANALSDMKFERSAARRVAFRSPYDIPVLWERLLGQAASLSQDLMSELFTKLKADDQLKSFLLDQIGRSLDDERKLSKIVEMSLEYPASYSLVSLLFKLRQKSPGQADLLFRSALQRAASGGDLLSMYWLGAYAIPGINLPNRFPVAEIPAPDPSLSRLFINTLAESLAKVVMSDRVPGHVYGALVNIRPYAERFAPETVGRIDSLLNQLVGKVHPKAMAESERLDLARFTPAEEKVEQFISGAEAAKDDKSHDDLMTQAAFLLMSERKQFDRALMVASRIRDKTLQGEMRELINFNAAMHFAEKGSLDDAELYALGIDHPERLAIALASLVDKFRDKPEEKDRLLALVARAEDRLKVRLQSKAGEARSFLHLAGAVIWLDQNQGEGLLWRAINSFNESGADLNGAAEASIRVETGDFATGSVIGPYDLSPIVIRIFSALPKLDRDLQRSPMLATYWRSREIRAISGAALARAVLDELSRKEPTAPGGKSKGQ
jgi:hypothetical protein